MPSPFPGMDPYLGAPDIWPDVHNALAAQIRDELNRGLPEPYYTRLDVRAELGVVDEDEGGWSVLVPGVAVLSGPRDTGPREGVAVLERLRREVSPGRAVEVLGARRLTGK